MERCLVYDFTKVLSLFVTKKVNSVTNKESESDAESLITSETKESLKSSSIMKLKVPN